MQFFVERYYPRRYVKDRILKDRLTTEQDTINDRMQTWRESGHYMRVCVYIDRTILPFRTKGLGNNNSILYGPVLPKATLGGRPTGVRGFRVSACGSE